LADIDKETVDFTPNYDESQREPTVFPSRLPNLLINGSAGIAVGMATNIPPHNLGEVIDGCVACLDRPEIGLEELMQLIPGPDFPTAGVISGAGGIVEAYRTGRGRIFVRAKAHIEDAENGGRDKIVVTELPYQVNKARLVEKIAELHKEKKIEGIAELRDESDRKGMRVVIEVRRGENAEVLLNNLYQHTAMESAFGINMVALVNNQPKLLTLKQLLEAFLRHRREVVTRRTIYELRKARERAHVLEGLAVALANIDPIIALIKSCQNRSEARDALIARRWASGVVKEMLARAGAEISRPDDLPEGLGLDGDEYALSEDQANAILDLQLHRLTGLEQDKIVTEYDEILVRIRDLLEILSNPDRLREVVRGELLELREAFADQRRTVIEVFREGFDPLDLIKPQDVVVTLSHAGYAKWQPLEVYAAQRRGGKGKTATSMKAEDFVEKLVVANTHDTIMCFSSRGKVYWLKVYELPEASRTARGKPIVNLLPLEENERINAVLRLSDFDEQGYVVMATASGLVKKTPVKDFSRPRSTGLIAIDLVDDDTLVGVAVTNGERDIMLAASGGKMIRFNETQVRPMGRTARGVIGMRLLEGERVMSLIVADDGLILCATENGYGKCTRVDEYPLKGRGGQGVISVQTSERNGPVVGALLVSPADEVMLITDQAKLVRTAVSEISVLGRNTQGVRLITLNDGERLVGVESVIDED
ncbi:MAG: DNA gyrase subunit A, partial [Gammaproteobacteria bacterium]|nr:DNA gyrase subunit A [Gammaproteobacteria bacterium]